MAMNTSLNPIPASRFGLAEAHHLLQRAGFGGSPHIVAELAALGPTAAVDRLLAFHDDSDAELPDPRNAPAIDPDVLRPATPEERRAYARARRREDEAALERFRRELLARRGEDRAMFHELQQWWIERMCATPRPMQEKLTLLWHGHFATRYRDVRDSYLMYQQNAFFRRHAAGSFADLAAGIVRDPAMIRFLNNDRNVRRRPNENLARELMELFTLGEGRYTEHDIKEAARALTGYHADDNDFAFRRAAHDSGTKTILGQRGDFDGDSLVTLLLRQPACPLFVAIKLYRHFVADVGVDYEATDRPHQRAIKALAEEVEGRGYRLAPVLRTLLLSQHFYDPSIVGRKIKSPAQLLVGTVRTLGTPTRNTGVLNQAMRMMGQELFNPPSVAGWDGGRAWVNTSTLFVRQNLCAYLITGKHPQRGDWDRDRVAYDPMQLLADLPQKTPVAVVEYLADALLGPRAASERRGVLVKFMQEREQGVTADSVLALLLLITAMPEYQLC